MPVNITTNAGLYPKRTQRNTASLPQTTQSAIFTINGGKVKVHGIYGEVTTAIQNQANATKLIHNPTVGSDTDLCATLDIDNDTVGTVYYVTGDVSDAMVDDANGMVDATPTAFTKELVLSAGTIDLDCAASNTGSVKWVVEWSPIDPGSTVTAA